MDKQGAEKVSDERRNVLVILTGGRETESLEQVCVDCRVLQSASSRVGVVECHPNPLVRLLSIPGVTVVADGDLPSGIRESLNEGEALFAEAWLSQNKENTSKQRRGEGLPWDDPNFLPPDQVGG